MPRFTVTLIERTTKRYRREFEAPDEATARLLAYRTPTGAGWDEEIDEEYPRYEIDEVDEDAHGC